MIHFLRHKSIRCLLAAADAVAVAGADQPNAGSWLQVHSEIRKTVISKQNLNRNSASSCPLNSSQLQLSALQLSDFQMQQQ
ncbi:MAG: hypothetical protein D6719_03930 [Candidatus Dadabacteria bacterium]|nr:MAG: hypothetical protein D6719_03930 [Candidatus Dadabacteria bacterium]